jgi:hypothetical protein
MRPRRVCSVVMRCLGLRWLLALGLTACGGTSPRAEPASPDTVKQNAANDTAAGEPEGATDTASNAAESGIPTACATAGEVCQPPKAFVNRLCQDVYPGVALVMFRNGTPWTRAYLTRKTQAWNASGGASLEGWLEFDEEVVVLKERKAAQGGMQVSGAGGGYEALRLNGSCVTLSGEEVTLNRPPQPKYPKLEWRYLDNTIREALREDAGITDAYRVRHRECKGVNVGEVSKQCVTADQKLSDLIVDYVKSGADLPEPEKMP